MTNKPQIAGLRAMLASIGGYVVYHDDKIEPHDRQIEGLLQVAQEHSAQMRLLDARVADLVRATENLERQWQAYINMLPRQ